MKKAFLINSTLAIALSFITGSIMPAMAESQVTSSTKLEVSKKLLRSKLADLNFFSANFKQEVVSEKGE